MRRQQTTTLAHGTTELVFRYTVVKGDTDTDGVIRESQLASISTAAASPTRPVLD